MWLFELFSCRYCLLCVLGSVSAAGISSSRSVWNVPPFSTAPQKQGNLVFSVAVPFFCRYSVLVSTKSMNRDFRAFWLAPLNRNTLGYLLFCDRSQDGFSFRDIFGRRNLCDKWSIRTNKYQESNELRLVARKLFSDWICDKMVKCTWKNPEMFVNCKQSWPL